jgi:dTDP-4-dehydrorhamnose reductase
MCRLLPELGEVIALGRQEMDLAQPAGIRRGIREYQPNLIVNAAAYTAVDRAETERELAHAVNAVAPAVMAEEARKLGATLVHYSTDYVFDGRKDSPYEETDDPNPISVYGATKLAGEEAIRASGVPYFIFRTAWVYAPRGRNFLMTVLRLATGREELKVVSDQVGAPTWSREVAEATVRVLAGVLGPGELDPASLVRSCGIYHMTARGVTSWFEFAASILEEARRAPQDLEWYQEATEGRPLLTQRVLPISSREYSALARRPAYSVLSNAKLERIFGVQLRDWRSQLRAVFAEV